MPGNEGKVKVNPTLQEILDHDIAVHNMLLELATPTENKMDQLDATNMILAVGLAAIHERLGQMWRWDKAVDPS